MLLSFLSKKITFLSYYIILKTKTGLNIINTNDYTWQA